MIHPDDKYLLPSAELKRRESAAFNSLCENLWRKLADRPPGLVYDARDHVANPEVRRMWGLSEQIDAVKP